MIERETKADRTRQRILEVAAREFAARGYDGTSLRRVATGAELQLGSLYFHFASKADLVAEVVRDAVDAALSQIDAALLAHQPLRPGEGLALAIRTNFTVLHEVHDRGAAVVRFTDPSTPTTADARRHVRRYVARWRELIEAAQGDQAVTPSLDPAVVCTLLIGAMNGTVGRRQLDAATVNELADSVVKIFTTTQR